MASQSCRRKHGCMMRPDILARLLQDGAGVLDPDEKTVAVAEQLRDLGMLRLRWSRFVRCAEPGDSDFSRSNRHCPGQIYLGRSNQDWLRCPECERLVYPEEDQKRSFRELCVRVLPQGQVTLDQSPPLPPPPVAY